jgi:hypothetical protein
MIRRAAVAVVVVAAATAARADTPTDAPTAIDVERVQGLATGWWLGLDDPRVLGTGHLAFGLTTSVIARPIRLRDPAGADLGSPVEYRTSVIAAAAYGVTDSIELDASVPIAIQSGDRLMAVGDPAVLRRITRGDLRLGGKFQVVDRDHVRVAFAADVLLPTGDEDHYAGEASWAIHWRALAALHVGSFGAAVSGGVRIRGEEVALAADQVAGNEVITGIAVAYQLPGIRGVYCSWTQLRVIGELDAVLGDAMGGSSGPSPVEARVGVRGRIWRGWTLGVAAGRGLTDEVGAPQWRGMLDITWRDEPRSEIPRAQPIVFDPDDCDNEDCD